MRINVILLAMGLLFVPVSIFAEQPAVSFAKKPTVTKTAAGTKIEFAVDRETDVAVFIEDADGKIVRHLAAGVLGKNPPPPFKAGSLEQSIEWDGKADYGRSMDLTAGKPAGAGPFKVRVALGLGAKYDTVLSSRPLSFAGQSSLGVGPDGALYVRVNTSDAIYGHCQIVVLNRDGTYRRTLMPFPSTAGGGEGRGLPVMELDGHRVPVKSNPGDIASWGGPPYSSMAVSPDGRQLYSISGGILRLATDLAAAEGHARISLPGTPWVLHAHPNARGETVHGIASVGYNTYYYVSPSPPPDSGRRYYGWNSKTKTDYWNRSQNPASALPLWRASVETVFGIPCGSGQDGVGCSGMGYCGAERENNMGRERTGRRRQRTMAARRSQTKAGGITLRTLTLLLSGCGLLFGTALAAEPAARLATRPIVPARPLRRRNRNVKFAGIC